MDLLHAAFEPAGAGPHPTVIALHGWGANALDLLGLAPHLGGGRYLVLCPQGPVQFPIGPGVNGYGWFPLSMGRPPDRDAFVAAVGALEDFLDQAIRRYPIAADRLALLGFSQGGVMAYALALAGRRRFAALAALSTWLVRELVLPAGGSPQLARLPVLVQHGTGDEMIPVDRAREAVELLRQWSAEVIYREYDMGHEINAASLRELSAFLDERLRPATMFA